MRKHPKHRNHTNPNFNIRPLSPAAVERLLYGESLPDKHTRERLQQARKEHAMPDIKTALESALKTTIQEWANDDKPYQPQEKAKMKLNVVKTQDNKVRFMPTNNVSRDTFNFVQQHPDSTRAEVVSALTGKGHNKASVTSLIGQYVRCAYFTQSSDGKLRCVLPEYKSLPSTAKQMRLAKQLNTPKAKPKAKATSAGIAALTPATTTAPLNTQFDPKALLNTLSVMQARALYDELKQIFGFGI